VTGDEEEEEEEDRRCTSQRMFPGRSPPAGKALWSHTDVLFNDRFIFRI